MFVMSGSELTGACTRGHAHPHFGGPWGLVKGMCKDPLASRSKDPIPGLRQLHPACVRRQHSLSNICNLTMSLFGSKKRHSDVGDKVGDASRPPSVLSDDRGHSVVVS